MTYLLSLILTGAAITWAVAALRYVCGPKPARYLRRDDVRRVVWAEDSEATR